MRAKPLLDAWLFDVPAVHVLAFTALTIALARPVHKYMTPNAGQRTPA